MNTVQELKDIVRAWQGKRVGVIGDVILDHYIEGEVTRISPEAPVPIVNIRREWYAPGGAANVAANVAALGGEVELYGVIGVDEAGDQLVSELKKRGVSLCFTCLPTRPTTEKVRILAHNQQLVRIDREERMSINPARMGDLWNKLVDWTDEWDAVILSDYAKGVLVSSLVMHTVLCAFSRDKPVIGDPKPRNIRSFREATVLTPNTAEAAEIVHSLQVADCQAAAAVLGTTFLVTAGGGGMTLHSEKEVVQIPTAPRYMYDVIGAGDTVTATVGLALATGTSILEAARIANAAAGVVVGKRGTATVSTDELFTALDEIEEHEGTRI